MVVRHFAKATYRLFNFLCAPIEMAAINLWYFLNSQNLSIGPPEPPIKLPVVPHAIEDTQEVIADVQADINPNFIRLLSLLRRLAVDLDSSPIYLAKWMELEGKPATTVVSLSERRIVKGYLFGDSHLSRGGIENNIYFIYVFPPFRSTGVSTIMLGLYQKEAIDRAKAVGAKSITFRIDLKPCLLSSTEFWIRHGFTRPHAYSKSRSWDNVGITKTVAF